MLTCPICNAPRASATKCNACGHAFKRSNFSEHSSVLEKEPSSSPFDVELHDEVTHRIDRDNVSDMVARLSAQLTISEEENMDSRSFLEAQTIQDVAPPHSSFSDTMSNDGEELFPTTSLDGELLATTKMKGVEIKPPPGAPKLVASDRFSDKFGKTNSLFQGKTTSPFGPSDDVFTKTVSEKLKDSNVDVIASSKPEPLKFKAFLEPPKTVADEAPREDDETPRIEDVVEELEPVVEQEKPVPAEWRDAHPSAKKWASKRTKSGGMPTPVKFMAACLLLSALGYLIYYYLY